MNNKIKYIITNSKLYSSKNCNPAFQTFTLELSLLLSCSFYCQQEREFNKSSCVVDRERAVDIRYLKETKAANKTGRLTDRSMQCSGSQSHKI